jgi:hypothetical protein
MRPWLGTIGAATDTILADPIVLTLDRPGCSLQPGMVPNCRLWSEDYSSSSPCTGATLDGLTLSLSFGGDVQDGGHIIFADRDPAIRGRQGEYMPTTPISQSEAPRPVVTVLQIDIGGGTGVFTMSEPCNFVGGVLQARTPDGLQTFNFDGGPDSGDGTAEITFTFQDEGATSPPPDAQHFFLSSGAFMAVSSGLTTAQIENQGWTEL